MLLFVSETGEDVIDAFDADTLKKVGRVAYGCHPEGAIGPRSGVSFGDKVVIAGCYNNILSLIDISALKVIKEVRVGAYPISMVCDEETVFTACGDSNSIWTIDKNFDVTFVDATVKFPFSMAINDDELCVCGFTEGEICVYNKKDLSVKECFTVGGYPYSAAYLGNKLLIAYNNEDEGMLFSKERVVKLGKRVSKILVTQDNIYACVNDNSIIAIDSQFSFIREICMKDAIADFAVAGDSIFVSGLLGGEIIKFSNAGKEEGRIKVNSFGSSLLLS